MPTVHIRVRGKVQGVFYRATAREVAEAAGLKGWVKNTDAGDVEAEVTGDAAALDRYIAWCHKGPPAAVVREVIVTPLEERAFERFQVLR